MTLQVNPVVSGRSPREDVRQAPEVERGSLSREEVERLFERVGVAFAQIQGPAIGPALRAAFRSLSAQGGTISNIGGSLSSYFGLNSQGASSNVDGSLNSASQNVAENSPSQQSTRIGNLVSSSDNSNKTLGIV